LFIDRHINTQQLKEQKKISKGNEVSLVWYRLIDKHVLVGQNIGPLWQLSY